MQQGYTLFIDESGEAGLDKLRSETEKGASPYMTFGAALIPNEDRDLLEEKLQKISTHIRKKDLHCSQLKHAQILYFAKEMVQERVRFFGIISRKETLGWYKDRIEADPQKYYNKCVQYLLERVGWFLETRGIQAGEVSIVLEKANCDYGMMRNFLGVVQANPIRPMSKKLVNLNVEELEAKSKSEEPLLKIADLVAHALFKCVDKSSGDFGIPEPRYLKEIAPRFFGKPGSQRILGAGLHCVHSLSDARLDDEVREVVMGLEAAV